MNTNKELIATLKDYAQTMREARAELARRLEQIHIANARALIAEAKLKESEQEIARLRRTIVEKLLG